MPLYFDSKQLPPIAGQYILWFDGMGTGRAFMSSLENSAHFIFKLHQAFEIALQRLQLAHQIYPLMDGLYLTSPCRRDVQAILAEAIRELAQEFVAQKGKYDHQFMVRGGVAYGATLHGGAIPDEAFVKQPSTSQQVPPDKCQEPDAKSTEQVGSLLAQTRSRLLISTAMTPAFYAERLAPPFGIYVDNSALTAPQLVDPSDSGFSTNLWRWWEGRDDLRPLVRELSQEVLSYLASAESRSHELGYPIERIRAHQKYAHEYFRAFLPAS